MKVNITTNRQDLRRIRQMPGDYMIALKRGVGYAMKFLVKEIQGGLGQHGRPKNRTGKLRDSFKSHVDGIDGIITSDSPYAMIHEYGGVIQGKPWFMFSIGGNFKTVRQVSILSLIHI